MSRTSLTRADRDELTATAFYSIDPKERRTAFRALNRAARRQRH